MKGPSAHESLLLSSESSARLRFRGSASRSFRRGKSDISILNPTKRGRTFIRARNRECSSGASAFTQQTAASIAIANKSAPITSPTISSGNGAIAAARRAITFLSVRYFSEKCGWARTSQTLARAHPRPRNLRRLQEQHPAARSGGLQPARRSLSEGGSAVFTREFARHSTRDVAPGLRLPARLRQMHHRRRDSGPALLRHHPDKWRTLLPEEAALPHRARRLPARHGRSRQPVCRRCILPRGIMCIFMRRAASILIQTCRRTVSSTKNDASPESVLQRRCNFRVPMRHRQAGRLFPRTMQNVLWLI